MRRGWMERLLERLLPDEVAEEVLGDLWEERARRRGGRLARLRDAVRALVIACRFAVRRPGGIGLGGDLRLALRRLRRDPTFAFVSIGAFALGIGANVLMLAVAQAVLFGPLPYPEPDRLALLTNDHSGSDTGGFGVSWDNVRDLRERSRTVESVALYLDWQDVALQAADGATRIPSAFVSDEYQELLGLRPRLGRLIRADENRPHAAAPVAVLGHGTWRTAFGADPDVVGRSVLLNGRPFEVVGVAADDRGDLRYRWGMDPVGIYLPLFAAEELAGFTFEGNRGGRYFNALLRLTGATSVDAAQEELARISGELALAHPEVNEGWRYRVQALDEALYEALRPATTALLGISAMVLALVAVNLLTLTLLRAVGRTGEVAMRRALGAGSPRILRQLVTESLVLSLAGALVGLTVGSWGIGAFRAQDAVRLPEYAVISLDFRIVGISLVAALVLAGILALGPSLALLRDRDGMGALGSSRASTGATGSRVRSSLVAGEVALALVLLVGAGLLLESYRTLRGTGYGFDTERLFLAQVDLNGEERVAEDQRILARALSAGAAALPGVEGAFIWSPNRLGHGNRVSILTAEDRWDTHPEERVEASQHAVHPGALDALGIRRLAGRDIEPSDREGNPRVALVSESLARRLWPGEEPVGRRMETREGGVPVTVEVVGVVGDARHRTRLINPFQDQLDVYYAFEQRPWPFLTVSLRYEPGTQVESLARDVRTLVRDLEPSAPVHGVTTMAQRMRDEEGTSRLGAWLVGAYGVLATALAALGLYGVLAHSVRLRLREIGIRQALGADRGRVLRNVLGRGLGMVALGLLAGSVGAYLLGPLMAAALYGVEPTAWRVFVSVVVLLGAAATAACLLPAWHATRVDPATILRTD